MVSGFLEEVVKVTGNKSGIICFSRGINRSFGFLLVISQMTAFRMANGGIPIEEFYRLRRAEDKACWIFVEMKGLRMNKDLIDYCQVSLSNAIRCRLSVKQYNMAGSQFAIAEYKRHLTNFDDRVGQHYITYAGSRKPEYNLFD